MASITLTGIWLALLADLDTQLHFTKVRLTGEHTVPGGFQVYANGVVRVMRGTGKFLNVPVQLLEVTRTERETLEEWQGQDMVQRDSRGRMLFGTYLDLRETDTVGPYGMCDLSYTFGAITHSIEV